MRAKLIGSTHSSEEGVGINNQLDTRHARSRVCKRRSTAARTAARDHATVRGQALPPSASRNVHKPQLSPDVVSPWYTDPAHGRYVQSDLDHWCLSANSGGHPSRDVSPYHTSRVRTNQESSMARHCSLHRIATQTCTHFDDRHRRFSNRQVAAEATRAFRECHRNNYTNERPSLRMSMTQKFPNL